MTDALHIQLQQLVSESQNPATKDIDLGDSLEIAQQLHAQDAAVHIAIEQVLPEIGQAIDVIVSALSSEGRLIYIGAGTSGRLGVLDAVECIPTFGIPEGQVIGLLAGGEPAMFKAQEGVEDQPESGRTDLQSVALKSSDVVVGIAASGRTPYVMGGLAYANEVGAKTIAISCNNDAKIKNLAQLSILPIVGPETPAGSSRMKAGTAQKQILNMLSTATMIRLGKCYQNLMIDLKPSNAKLRARSINMLMKITTCDEAMAEKALQAADDEVKTAVYMLLSKSSADDARQAIARAGGFLRKALQSIAR